MINIFKNYFNKKIFTKTPIILWSHFILLSSLALYSCSAVTPIVTSAAIGFAKNLLMTSESNYTVEYANDLKNLLSSITARVEPLKQNIENLSASKVTKISLNAEVLIHRADTTTTSPLTILKNGDTLYGHPTNPVKGDRFKISFKANCECYIYIIAIDSTGFVVSAFPDFDITNSALVKANTQYTIPKANEWYGLDQYVGVEEIYFIASYQRRINMEAVIQKMSAIKRKDNINFASVKEAAIIPLSRGIVKVKVDDEMSITLPNGQQKKYSATNFLSTISGADLTITKWFYHK